MCRINQRSGRTRVRKPTYAALLGVLVLVFPALGYTQMQAPSSQNGANSNNTSNSVQNQSGDTLSTFDDFVFKVRRLIKEPNAEGSFRLIMTLTDKGDAVRRVALVAPMAVLMDDMGNIYNAVDSKGVSFCNNASDLATADGCWRYYKKDTIKLTPKLPTTLVLYVSASSENFSQELADMASIASLRLRLGYFPQDFKAYNTADIVINDIQIPQ